MSTQQEPDELDELNAEPLLPDQLADIIKVGESAVEVGRQIIAAIQSMKPSVTVHPAAVKMPDIHPPNISVSAPQITIILPRVKLYKVLRHENGMIDGFAPTYESEPIKLQITP